MVMGIHILPAGHATKQALVRGNRKSLTLVIQEQPGRFGAEPGLGYALSELVATHSAAYPALPALHTTKPAERCFEVVVLSPQRIKAAANGQSD